MRGVDVTLLLTDEGRRMTSASLSQFASSAAATGHQLHITVKRELIATRKKIINLSMPAGYRRVITASCAAEGAGRFREFEDKEDEDDIQ